jgi:hypothetical protein
MVLLVARIKMTVAELIESLSSMPADAEVVHYSYCDEYGPESVEPMVMLMVSGRVVIAGERSYAAG